MLDYYGSTDWQLEDIKRDLFNIPKYKQYSKKYIIELINYLHIRRFILDTYSYSGWGIFNKQIIIKKMDEYIALDTINCKKKVALMLQLTNSKYFPYEPVLFKIICDQLKVKLIR